MESFLPCGSRTARETSLLSSTDLGKAVAYRDFCYTHILCSVTWRLWNGLGFMCRRLWSDFWTICVLQGDEIMGMGDVLHGGEAAFVKADHVECISKGVPADMHIWYVNGGTHPFNCRFPSPAQQDAKRNNMHTTPASSTASKSSPKTQNAGSIPVGKHLKRGTCTTPNGRSTMALTPKCVHATTSAISHTPGSARTQRNGRITSTHVTEPS